MSKVKLMMAQRISVSNCECCGGVNIELWRDGRLFAMACPGTAEIADRLALDIAQAAERMRKSEGKPHVH